MTPRRLTTILGSYLLLSAGAAVLLVQVQNRLGVPDDLINLAMLAVVGGAVLVWLIWPDTRTVTVTRRDPMRSVYLAIFIAALVVLALAYLTRRDNVNGWLTPHLDSLPTALVVVLALQLLAVFAEELGWRGLVQPLLERKFPVVWAGVITGLLSAAGYLIVVPETEPTFRVFFILGVVVGSIGLSVTLAVITTGFSLVQRVLIATLFRILLVVGFLLFFEGDDEGWLWEVNSGIALAVVALVLLRAKRRRDNTAILADRYGTETEKAILR
jgi:membrane protease YdiL (CAAX protease family)